MDLKNEIAGLNKRVENHNWQAVVILNDEGLPIRKRGVEFLNRKQDLLLAICLNNGYYNRENIYRMLRFSLNFSNRVSVFFTDGPAKHNFRAKGYSEDKVLREARLDRNRLRNHCLAALERIKIEEPENKSKVIFLDWVDIYKDETYLKEYECLMTLYEENLEFHKDINTTTAKVLKNRLQEGEDINSKVPIAIKYVIEEMAFILAYPNLSETTKQNTNHGANGFSYTYYEPWPVFENLVEGKYDGIVREKIGFILVKI
ncbi:MAG: uncharacterized protein JWN37_776 [Candidatus Nomurabacteria bacterium]|nr:uncharacterized protein [Candidatus Nomurabacteria bacterium]